ncbi:hypothetical protein GCM10023196_066930 [Actinoallomurus vinaceus]|uniref:Uncharacterized protein n=1 Tax=Actinoallomurus vinaceus TaxID=1080074 RepID=A0ABP8UL57_9ACTN
MWRINHLMLVPSFLSAGLILGSTATQASTSSGSERTIVDDVSPPADDHGRESDTETQSDTDTQYSAGYDHGYEFGIKDGRNSCTKVHRKLSSTANYLLGWAVGYNAGYSTECPHSSKPKFHLRGPHTE